MLGGNPSPGPMLVGGEGDVSLVVGNDDPEFMLDWPGVTAEASEMKVLGVKPVPEPGPNENKLLGVVSEAFPAESGELILL